MQYIIFTDLDGTLIDYDTYSYEAAMLATHILEVDTTHILYQQE